MKTNHILQITLFLLILASCAEKKEEFPIVTKQIQYVVELRNPDTIPDKKHKYLDDSTRSDFVKNIVDQVLAADVQAYQWENDTLVPFPVDDFKKRIINGNSVPDSVNPVDLKKVSKIRYFEEWAMDKKTLVIRKRVLAISLLLDNYDETGQYRGFEPLFYIFYDKDYKGTLEALYKQ
jgi:hypothetical protein